MQVRSVWKVSMIEASDRLRTGVGIP